MKKIYKTIDLFAGIGGIRKGFENTKRFKNIISAEKDKYACMAYEHLYGENPSNDVTSKEFKDSLRNIEYDILLAGFPCQSFSISGLKKGFEDEKRGTLFFDLAEIIENTKPKSFMLENVEGLITNNKGETFKMILKILDNIGYKVVGVDVDEKNNFIFKKENFLRTPYNFGIPQKRSRVFIMGFRKDLIPKNYIFKELPKSRELHLYKNLNDLLDNNVDDKFYLSEKYFETLNRHKNKHKEKKSGFGYIIVNDTDNPIANTIMATGGSGKERNLIRQHKEYSKTSNNLNKEFIRKMTPNEWGKLQGFINYAFIENGTDTFSFPEKLSNTQRYKLFGNSICIPIVESMAEYMLERLDEFYEK